VAARGEFSYAASHWCRALTGIVPVMALLSAVLVFVHPTRPAAAGALVLNAVASAYGWWQLFG
jgi:hypothetical protein